MARPILLVGAALWALAGAGGLAIVMARMDLVTSLLPTLALAEASLAATVAALAGTCLAIAAIHVIALTGLARSTPWGTSAAILLAAVLGTAFVAWAAASATSAVAGTLRLDLAIAATAASGALAAGYGAVAVDLVGRLRGPRGRA